MFHQIHQIARSHPLCCRCFTYGFITKQNTCASCGSCSSVRVSCTACASCITCTASANLSVRVGINHADLSVRVVQIMPIYQYELRGPSGFISASYASFVDLQVRVPNVLQALQSELLNFRHLHRREHQQHKHQWPAGSWLGYGCTRQSRIQRRESSNAMIPEMWEHGVRREQGVASEDHRGCRRGAHEHEVC